MVILVTCCALLVCWPLAEVLALDPRPADLVAIGKVVEDPQHFNLHRVRFQGTITKITALPNQGGWNVSGVCVSISRRDRKHRSF